jgi:ribosomal protein S4E
VFSVGHSILQFFKLEHGHRAVQVGGEHFRGKGDIQEIFLKRAGTSIMIKIPGAVDFELTYGYDCAI